MSARIEPDGPAGRARAIEVLRTGGLVALPTDTVYGIGVALRTPGGIERLFAAKRRPPDRAIMLLLSEPRQADTVGVFGRAAAALAAAGWPGGLTLVLPQRPAAHLPAVLTGGAPTIGVRLPDHDAPRTLARALGPLPVTSANIAGEPTARTAAEVAEQLGSAVDLVLDGGPSRSERPSTVVDCSGDRPRILRAGAIAPTVLAAALDAAGLSHDIAPE